MAYNLCGSFNAKVILVEEQPRYYLSPYWRDKKFHAFSEGIRQKVNVMARLSRMICKRKIVVNNLLLKKQL